MRYLGLRTLTQFLHGHQPGPEAASSSSTGASTTGGHRAGRRHPRRRRDDAERPLAHHRPSRPTRRAPRTTAPLGRHVLQRPGRHDLRRVERDPAQHHRRDGARPAQGARAAPTRLLAGRSRRRSPDARLGRGGAASPSAHPRCGSPPSPGAPLAGPGWWRRPPFLPFPTRATSASGWRPPTAARPTEAPSRTTS